MTGARLGLRAGDEVEVRSREEILGTLDQQGALDGLPFMPEMLEFCGRRLTVASRADKTCDTVAHSGLRRMVDTVHLAGTRCTGAAHGGCQAACHLFWKEAWLKRVPANGRHVPSRAPQAGCTDAQLLAATTRAPENGDGSARYRCQATQLLEASTPLRPWDLRQYLRDLVSGNVRLFALLETLAWTLARFAREHLPGYRAQVRVFNAFQRLHGGTPFTALAGPNQRTPAAALGLQPGETVTVRPIEEIRSTLDAAQKNRGLYFDHEMAPHCGGTFQVRSRVTHIIEESTGRMINLPGGCVILEGAVCTGRYHGRCPRAIYPFWREIWLRRPS